MKKAVPMLSSVNDPPDDAALSAHATELLIGLFVQAVTERFGAEAASSILTDCTQRIDREKRARTTTNHHHL